MMMRSPSPSFSPVLKRRRLSSTPLRDLSEYSAAGLEYGSQWQDWPAPRVAMSEAREFIVDIVKNKRSVLIVPDKDADGLSAGTLLYRTLVHMGHAPSLISTHHLAKGNNVHSDAERDLLIAKDCEKLIVLDQGSRPGRSIVPPREGLHGKRVLVIDHHMCDEWPEDTQVLTACHTPPIATAALLTYTLVRDLHPKVQQDDSWRAVVGVIGDLGTSVAKWGTPPWPSDLGNVTKRFGSKVFSEAVSGINAPLPKAWDIMLNANSPNDMASNAFLKLCKLDVGAETVKWARTLHPVIATRWAGTLGRKSKNLLMVMCANTGFNPNPDKVSFSCRIAASLRSLPEERQPLLNDFGDRIPGFRERVGGDFARGHKEATGGIIPKTEFELLLEVMGVSSVNTKATSKKPKGKVIDPKQITGIQQFFKPRP
ncbi:hypothetical protein IAR55_006253 [Kwoniella newhampshirensis]|uniref:DDH domain-containing protein n=1 Tax=Kwoniella newhampshirensis TaxID=1651941 RepID=A0AAW0YXY1_9TREE